MCNQVEIFFLIGIDIVARRADQRASFGRVEFRNLLKEWIQMNVRHTRIEKTIKALDESIHFDLELICSNDRAVNGSVQRRSIASRSQNTYSLHHRSYVLGLRKWIEEAPPASRCSDAGKTGGH